MDTCIHSHAQLRADAIGATHQHRILVANGLQVEHADKPTDLRVRAHAARRAHVWLDRVHQRVARVHRDARLRIRQTRFTGVGGECATRWK